MSQMLVIALVAILSFSKVSAQFVGSTVLPQTAIEERKGGLSTYTVPGPGTDEYSWEVVGGTVTVPAAGVTGSGTVADPYVVPFAVGRQTIKVQWPADNNNITSVAGNVSTQRKVVHAAATACPSKIQSLDVAFWSAATIKVNDVDYELCSGDATLGPITVQFTGAPNFDYKYTVTDLAGVTGAPVVVTGATAATQTIALPANLVNTSTTVDQTYVVTLTEMNDSFTGLGSITDATFTITVHPTVETGVISSDRTLTRR
jgi:hypothetical protein